MEKWQRVWTRIGAMKLTKHAKLKMGKDKVKVWYDEETDIFYVSLKEGVAVDSEETEEGISIEYNPEKEIVGIEVPKASALLTEALLKRIKSNLPLFSAK